MGWRREGAIPDLGHQSPAPSSAAVTALVKLQRLPSAKRVSSVAIDRQPGYPTSTKSKKYERTVELAISVRHMAVVVAPRVSYAARKTWKRRSSLSRYRIQTLVMHYGATLLLPALSPMRGVTQHRRRRSEDKFRTKRNQRRHNFRGNPGLLTERAWRTIAGFEGRRGCGLPNTRSSRTNMKKAGPAS